MMTDNPVEVLEAVAADLKAIRYTEPAPSERDRYAEAWTQLARELANRLAQGGVKNLDQLAQVRDSLTPIERQLVAMPHAGDLELVLSHLVSRTLSNPPAQ